LTGGASSTRRLAMRLEQVEVLCGQALRNHTTERRCVLLGRSEVFLAHLFLLRSTAWR
jgi:hypothetical protein